MTFIHTLAQISHSHTSDRLSSFLSRFNRNEKFSYYWRLFTLIRSGYLAAELLIKEFTPQIRRVIVCKQDLRPVRRQCLTGCDKALESSWKHHSLHLCSTFEWIRFVKTVWQHESIRAVLVAIEGAEESYLTVFPVKITVQYFARVGLLITYSDLTSDQPSTKNWRLARETEVQTAFWYSNILVLTALRFGYDTQIRVYSQLSSFVFSRATSREAWFVLANKVAPF